MSFIADMNTLLNVTGVTQLVSDRIYPGIAPQDAAKPYLVWRRNGGDPLATLKGSSASRNKPNIVLFGCAEDYDAADAIAQAARAALIAGGTTIKVNAVGLPVDGFDPDTRLLTVAIEASVSYSA